MADYRLSEEEQGKDLFVVLKLEGEELKVVCEIETDDDRYEDLRTLYLDEYFYVTLNDEFYVKKESINEERKNEN